MELSSNLISEFAKITNDEKKESQAATVHGVYTTHEGRPHIQIDGSDVLTPISKTTVEAENGERVTAIIKNHEIIINGNTTYPATNKNKVDKVEIYLNDLISDVSVKIDTEIAGVNDEVNTLRTDLGTTNSNLSATDKKAVDAANAAFQAKQEAANAITAAGYAERYATNYLRADNYGLLVGNLTSGTLGKNVLIGTTYIDFRDGSTILASYGANSIDLGKNSPSTVINFCGGAGQIYTTSNHNSRTTMNLMSGSSVGLESGSYSIEVDSTYGIRLDSSGTGSTAYIALRAGSGTYIGYGLKVDGSPVSIEGHQHNYIYHSVSTGIGVGILTTGMSGAKWSLQANNNDTCIGSTGYRFVRMYVQEANNISSDMRLKEGFSTDFDKYISMLDLIEPKSYYLKSQDPITRKRHAGYIAQDVWAAMKEVGIPESEFAGFSRYAQEEGSVYGYALCYEEFIPILHAKIKQLEARIKQLENKEAV